MAPINIPEEALPDLKRIAGLGTEDFESFLSTIQETTPALNSGQFAEKIEARVRFLKPDELRSALKTVFVLHSIKERAGVASGQLAEDVGSSAAEDKPGDFPADTRELLAKRLKQLLDLDKPLGVTAKALDVMTEHDRVFCGARILSDIRPVFAANPESAESAVIIHNLQIGFHQGGEHKEFYVALDTNDVKELKKVIERAEKKTTALQSILNKANVFYLKP